MLLCAGLSCAAPHDGDPESTTVAVSAVQSDAEHATLVRKWSNEQATPIAERRTFQGDFDADGNVDLAVIVQLRGTDASRRFANQVTVLNPWLSSIEPQAKDPHETQSDKALLVFHGATPHWDGDNPKAVFLLLDAVYDEMSLVDRRSKSAIKRPRTAKGDCILTGTEEARGIICWNGKAYFWEQHGD